MIDIVSGQVASIDKASLVVMIGGIGLRINGPKTVFDMVWGPVPLVKLFTKLRVPSNRFRATRRKISRRASGSPSNTLPECGLPKARNTIASLKFALIELLTE